MAATPTRADVVAAVDAALRDFLAQRIAELVPISVELQPLFTEVAAFIRGGKRLRPTFAYCGYRAAGGVDCDEVLRAVAALEWLHVCALIHDDVMDGSAVRRGRPSVHEHFEAEHRRQAWRGDPARFGESVAILLGDFGLMWSDQMFRGAGLPAGAVERALPIFDAMRNELVAGQFLDIASDARDSFSVSRAQTVLRYKSGKYTVEQPLLLGAALANGSPEIRAALSSFGLAVGAAFQLRDDILGVFGDPAATGKPAGDDLREGKRTLLIAYAMAAGDADQTAFLRHHLGDPALGVAETAAIRELLTVTGARARVETEIAERTEQARAALSDVELAVDVRSILDDLLLAATQPMPS